jgi:hypothetical protein
MMFCESFFDKDGSMQSLFSVANAKGFGIVHYHFRFSTFH